MSISLQDYKDVEGKCYLVCARLSQPSLSLHKPIGDWVGNMQTHHWIDVVTLAYPMPTS
jgi:hypothetical protein